MVVILMGAPGTGKGTISELMSQYYDIPHISVGDLLRDTISKKNNIGLSDDLLSTIKEHVEKGLLLPDEIVSQIVEKRISLLDCKLGLILDGYPRTIGQAKDLYSILKKQNKELKAVINLETSKEEIIERILNRRVCPNCKAIYNLRTSPPLEEGICDKCDSKLVTRKDDTEEKIKVRLDEYSKKSYPLIDFYKATGKLFSVVVSDKAGKLGKTVLKEIVWYIDKN